MIFLYTRLLLHKMATGILELVSGQNQVVGMKIIARTILSLGRVPWFLCQHDEHVFEERLTNIPVSE